MFDSLPPEHNPYQTPLSNQVRHLSPAELAAMGYDLAQSGGEYTANIMRERDRIARETDQGRYPTTGQY